LQGSFVEFAQGNCAKLRKHKDSQLPGVESNRHSPSYNSQVTELQSIWSLPTRWRIFVYIGQRSVVSSTHFRLRRGKSYRFPDFASFFEVP